MQNINQDQLVRGGIRPPRSGSRRRESVRSGLLRPIFVAGVALLAAGIPVGCQSGGPSEYVSPRVTGRVLDGNTRRPLADVTVHRNDPTDVVQPGDPLHGGQIMERPADVVTGHDGTFVVESIRDLKVFDKWGWYSVSLSFQHSGYELLRTNYTLANATNLANGEPWVPAGDIFLRPLLK